MPEPIIPPEADDPSGRTPESQPKTAPNPSTSESDRDPSDGGTAGVEPLPPA